MQKDRAFNMPINTGKNQNFYSFSRADRFSKTNQSSCKQDTYYRDQLNATRAPSLGFGTRIEWVNKNTSPPGLYETSSQFLRVKSKGYSFAITPKKQLFQDQVAKVTPGPAKYAVHDQEPRGLAYSIGLLRKRHNHTPLAMDPGKYDPIEATSPRGNYFLSKFSSSKCPKLLSAKRFNYKYQDIPGPGSYTSRENDKRRTNSFDKSTRFEQNDSRPSLGPGQYYTYSQFQKK